MRRRADARRRARQHHALLVDQDGAVVESTVLGKQGRLLRSLGRRHPGGRERLSWRILSATEELGGTRVPEADLLQSGRERSALPSMGATKGLFQRAPSRLPIPAGLTPRNRSAGQWKSGEVGPSYQCPAVFGDCLLRCCSCSRLVVRATSPFAN